MIYYNVNKRKNPQTGTDSIFPKFLHILRLALPQLLFFARATPHYSAYYIFLHKTKRINQQWRKLRTSPQ